MYVCMYVYMYSAIRFVNSIVCFNIVHANTKSMMLRQSICMQSPFITPYSRYNGSNSLFHADHTPCQPDNTHFSTN